MIFNIEILFVYLFTSVLDLFNLHIIFQSIGFKQQTINNSKSWVRFLFLFYLSITFLFGYTTCYNYRILSVILFIPYYIKAICLMYNYYKNNKNFIMLTLLYISVVSFLGQTFYLSIHITPLIESNDYLDAYFYDGVAAFILFLVLIILYHLRKKTLVHAFFYALPSRIYLIFFATLIDLGLLESIVFQHNFPSQKALNIAKILICILVFLNLFLIIQILLFNKQKITKNEIIEFLEDKLKNLNDYYHELTTKDTDLRRFKHDSKNLLLILKTLISEGNYDKALNYMSQIEGACENTSNSFNTGNFICDAILATKSRDAKSFGTLITIEGAVPSNQINDVDFCILFSNLLDNALDACNALKKDFKEITIKSICKNQTWILIIKNPVAIDVKIEKNYIPTSKEDDKQHGFGLKNIKKIADKYNGIATFTCENLIFTATVSLTLP